MSFKKLPKQAKFKFGGIEFTKITSTTAKSPNGKEIPFVDVPVELAA